MLHTLPAHTNSGDEVREPERKKTKLASPTANISRLVSVAEVVKREFSILAASQQEGSKIPPGTLLHQYNFIGCLPNPSDGQDDLKLHRKGSSFFRLWRRRRPRSPRAGRQESVSIDARSSYVV